MAHAAAQPASAALAWLPPPAAVDGPAARLRMHVLSALLLDGPSAPLYEARLARGLGTDWAPCTGFAAHAREPSLCLGVQGLRAGEEEAALDMVQDVLLQAARDGFPAARVEALLHQLELSNRFVSASFGLDLFQALLGPWLHGEPLRPLFAPERLVAALRREAAASPRLFPALLQEALLDNGHCVRFSMLADEAFAARASADEAAATAAQAAALDAAARAGLAQDAARLQAHQAQVQDRELLPSLAVADVPAAVERVAVAHRQLPARGGEARLQLAAQATNGLSFLRVALDAGGLPARLLPLLPLLAAVLTEMGTASRDYRALAQRLQQCTAGISAAPAAHRRHDAGAWRQERLLTLSSHALDAHVSEMAALMREVLVEPVFEDEERFRSLLDMAIVGMQESVVQGGHSYAAMRAAAFLGERQACQEEWEGVSQLRLLQELASAPLADTLAQLRELAALLATAPLRLSVVAEECALDAAAAAAAEVAAALGGPERRGEAVQPPPPGRTFLPLSAGVNFVAQAVAGPASHTDEWAAMKVLASILSQNYLHPRVREQGGAYGAGAAVSDGGVTCFSYRDPNLDSTLEAFDGMAAWALDPASFSAKDIDEAKLSVFGGIDAPVPPSRKGHGLFLTGVTDDQRQALREALLAVDAADLRRVAEQYLVAPAAKSVAVIGGAEAAEASRHEWTMEQLEAAPQ